MDPSLPQAHQTPDAAPSRQVACFKAGQVTRCVLLEAGRPLEQLTGGDKQSFDRQDVILGQVKRLVPALGAAFVAIGADHDAWLPLDQAPPGIKAGQPLIVQVRKLTPPGKGHQVTTRIQLPGPYAVYSPDRPPKKRTRLKELPPSEQETAFKQDLQRLQAQWAALQEAAQRGPVPRRLLSGQDDPLQRALLDWLDDRVSRVLTDDLDLYQQLADHIKTLMPWQQARLHFAGQKAGYSLAQRLGLTDLDRLIQQKKTWLPSGGFLVFQQTEALLLVDVNSGRDTGGSCRQALRFRTNQEAAVEVARQLRLRNIGGMDFLRTGPEDREKTDGLLRQALAEDRARKRLFGFSPMGLYELTRSRL